MALFRRRPLETDAILNGALDAAIARRPELAAQFGEPEMEFTLEEAGIADPPDASLPGLSGDALRSTFTDALGSRPVAPEAPPATIDPWAPEEIARIAPPSAGNIGPSATVAPRAGNLRTARPEARSGSLADPRLATFTGSPTGFSAASGFRMSRRGPGPAPSLSAPVADDAAPLVRNNVGALAPFMAREPEQYEPPAPLPRGAPEPERYADDELVDDSGALTGEVVAAPGLAPDAVPSTEQAATVPGLAEPVPVAPALPSGDMTEAERTELAKAQRRDRRLRIAQAVLGGVGGLTGAIGAAVGSPGAMGFGGGLSQAMQGNYATNARGVMADVNARRAQDLQRYQMENAAYRQQVSDQRAARQDERQARNDAVNADLQRARAEQARIQTTRMQEEWQNARGQRDAAAAWLQGLAHMYPDAPLSREVLAGFAEGGRLNNASQEQLDEYAGRFVNLAASGQVAGRPEIGRAPGGGGAMPPTPGTPDPIGDANGGVAIPTDVAGPERDIYVDAVRRGLDDPMNAVRVYRGGTDSIRTQMWNAAIGRNEARQANRFVLAEGLDRNEFGRVSRVLDQARGAYDQFKTVANRLERMIAQYGEHQVRLALQGDPRVVQIIGNDDLVDVRNAVARAAAEYRRQMTGQGGSNAEDERILGSLSMGSLANRPGATVSSLRGAGAEMMTRARNSVAGDYLTEWERRNREADAARRARSTRAGGGR